MPHTNTNKLAAFGKFTGSALIALITQIVLLVSASAQSTIPIGGSVPGLNAQRGAFTTFKVVIPSQTPTLVVETLGGTGDVDVYVRFGSPPTRQTYDSKSNGATTVEKITLSNVPRGELFIGLYAYSTYTGATLKVSGPGQSVPSTITLAPGAAYGPFSGPRGSEARFKVTIPANAASLRVSIASNDTGDADLYLRRGTPPSVNTWDFRPYLGGSNEQIEITRPEAGDYYIMVRGYTDYRNTTLLAKIQSDATSTNVITLTNGQLVSNLSGDSGSLKVYAVDVPSGSDYLSVGVNGSSGDADVYIKRGRAPTTSDFDARGYRGDANELAAILRPAADRFYVGVRGYTSYSNLKLRVEFGPVANRYPYANSDPDVADEWNFYTRECTSFAASRINQWAGRSLLYNLLRSDYPSGAPSDERKFGNAGHWEARARVLGFAVSTTPTVGAVAHWTGSEQPMRDGSPGVGHVAFCEAVGADGTVLVSEYNLSPAFAFGTRMLRPGDLRYPKRFIRFIEQ